MIKLIELLSKNPLDLSMKEDIEILRLAIIAELDAISLYEQFAKEVNNKEIKKILLDVAKEEKTHVGEFQALLKKYDKEYSEELINGEKEIKEKGAS